MKPIRDYGPGMAGHTDVICNKGMRVFIGEPISQRKDGSNQNTSDPDLTPLF
jgi:hypothetical protein